MLKLEQKRSPKVQTLNTLESSSPELLKIIETDPKLRKLLIQSSRSSYISPLPPPDIIAGYEEILPGSADRILTMTEEQGKHRRELEKLVIKEDIRRSNLGLRLAGIVTTIIIGCATYLAVNNREVTASVMAGTTIVALSANFIYGSVASKNERIEKQQKLLEAKYPKE
jgi:uncharacterized membrane protein